jgi:hypothetical protein
MAFMLVKDCEMLADACWAISRFTVTAEIGSTLMESGAMYRIVQLLGRNEKQILIPAARAVHQLAATGTWHLLDYVCNCGVLPMIGHLLS